VGPAVAAGSTFAAVEDQRVQTPPVRCPMCGSVEFVQANAERLRLPWRAFYCFRCHLGFRLDWEAFSARFASLRE
jgi:transposase-like protein